MKSRDLRRYARQTNLQLVVGAVLLLGVVGIGLIYWIYGAGAAVTGLLCLGGVVVPILLIALALWIIELVVKRANRE